MKLSDFDYALPKGLIAQYPCRERDRCRLMVLDRKTKTIGHRVFADIGEYFKAGDCLVLNNTKVIPARLFGRRRSGGKVEIFVLDRKNPVTEALIRPSARLKEGEWIALESGDEALVLGQGEIGRMVKFSRSLDDIIDKAGHVPLPPYVDRIDEESDKDNYQTVYARREGATASPTAGLHFTEKLLGRLSVIGVSLSYVTLHTSYGTFAPIKSEDIEKHRMHKEYFELPTETAETVRKTKGTGGKVFAVGTTSARVLEHCAGIIRGTRDPLRRSFSEASEGRGTNGHTGLFIYPGYQFKVIDHMITNFHLPKSTLLLLVSAFAGRDFIFEAYRKAIEMKYRFFSYGDAMLIV